MSTKFDTTWMNAGNIQTQDNKHSEHWSRKNVTTRLPRQTSNVGAIKKETLSTTKQKPYITWSAFLEMNQVVNSISKLCADKAT